MSDDGNHNFSVERGGRIPSLATGAATASSLIFNSKIVSNKGSDTGIILCFMYYNIFVSIVYPCRLIVAPFRHAMFQQILCTQYR